MNAPVRFELDTRPLALGDRQLSHPIVVHHFGAGRAIYPGDTMVSDLGARIVAGALAVCFDRIWDLATEHIPYVDQPQHQCWLDRISETHAELTGLAHGEDDGTAEAERDVWMRLDP